MCFSAPASFVASAVLCAIGIASCRLAGNKRQLLLAAIPLLFGIQQAAEGFVWLSFSYAVFEPWRLFFSYFFLFFAFIVWPTWVPLSVCCYQLQDQESPWAFRWERLGKQISSSPVQLLIQKMLIAVGAVVSGYLTMGLLTYDLVPQLAGCHVLYLFPMARPLIMISSVLYVAATIGSCLLSSIARIRVFGVLFALSYVASAIWYRYVFISVWCFFAAILSVGVWWIMRENSQK